MPLRAHKFFVIHYDAGAISVPSVKAVVSRSIKLNLCAVSILDVLARRELAESRVIILAFTTLAQHELRRYGDG